MAGFRCGGIVDEGGGGIELRSHGELSELAYDESRIGVLGSRFIREVSENGAVARRLVRLVVVGQPSVRLRVALYGGAEHPHAALRRVSWNAQSVRDRMTDDELRSGVTPFGCADVPTEGGRFVSFHALAERVALSQLEAGLHDPCLGLGNQIL